MSSVFSISSMVPSSNISHFKLYKSKCKSSPDPNCGFTHCKISRGIPLITKSIHPISRNKPHSALKFTARYNFESFDEENTKNFDWNDEREIEDMGSPWEGAVVYKRNPSILHVEHCTTLERLGLGKLSTEISKSRASVMGLRVTKAVKDYPQGTPVHISIDVTRKKHKLRLDGLLRTVITLGCNRYFPLLFSCIFSSIDGFLACIHAFMFWLIHVTIPLLLFFTVIHVILSSYTLGTPLYFYYFHIFGIHVLNSLLGKQIPRECFDTLFFVAF